ncbi:MAG: hypothetical protein ACMG55_15675 [Microcoleus sp.]
MNFSDSTRQFQRKSRATGDRTGSHRRQIPNARPQVIQHPPPVKLASAVKIGLL